MAVRIRMKRMGRRHRPYYRICAMDIRTPRDGRAIEELGTYDPSISDVDARARLEKERIDYWLSVGALPSDKVKVLIKKYGTDGTHLPQQEAALQRIAQARPLPPIKMAPAPAEAPASEPTDAPTDTPASKPTNEPAAEATNEPADAATDQATEPPTDEPASE